MANGTPLYNQGGNIIYPISDSACIISNVKEEKGRSVKDDLTELFKNIADLSGASGAINNIIIKTEYLATNTAEESEVKLLTNTWSDTFTLPEDKKPYVWKRTTYSYVGSSEPTIVYEIVASDVSTIIQNIYCRTTGVKPSIDYLQKQDQEGNLLYLDSNGAETTEVTNTPAYNYNFYANGKPANSFYNLPPGTSDYTWSLYPQDISNSFPLVFMASRLRINGIWEKFSAPAQYGEHPSYSTQ